MRSQRAAASTNEHCCEPSQARLYSRENDFDDRTTIFKLFEEAEENLEFYLPGPVEIGDLDGCTSDVLLKLEQVTVLQCPSYGVMRSEVATNLSYYEDSGWPEDLTVNEWRKDIVKRGLFSAHETQEIVEIIERVHAATAKKSRKRRAMKEPATASQDPVQNDGASVNHESDETPWPHKPTDYLVARALTRCRELLNEPGRDAQAQPNDSTLMLQMAAEIYALRAKLGEALGESTQERRRHGLRR